MRTIKLLVMAMLLAFTVSSLAHAGTQVAKKQYATVKAAVKNNTTRSVLAAVKVTGYDDANVVVGKLCKSVYLAAGKTTSIDFPWQAPNYGTGIYWSSKVEVGVACPSTTLVVHDDHDDDDDDDHDDDDHDDDGDDDGHDRDGHAD